MAEETKVISWTPSQEKALRPVRENLIISAAAGSGKTAVLTERIFRLLTDEKDPVSFSELVAITFTRAAAASLREKLSRRIERAVAEEPQNALYRRLLLQLPHAAISTVHSFCMSLIRENTALLKTGPNPTLMSDAQKDRMQKECMHKALSDLFDKQENRTDDERDTLSAVYYLLYQGQRTPEMTALPLSLYGQLMALEEGVGKLQDLCRASREMLNDLKRGVLNFFDTPTGNIAREQMLLSLGTILPRFETYFSFFPKEEAENESALPHAHALCNAARTAHRLITEGNHPAFVRLTETFVPVRYQNKCKEMEAKEKEDAKSFYDKKIKEPLLLLFKQYGIPEQTLLEEEEKRLCVQEVFSDLLQHFHTLYTEKKRARALLDYNDLEHLGLQAIRLGKTRRVRALFVDEYQDTNRLQDVLFRECVKKSEGFFFFVGDVKQSIYRFRNAAPELFLSYKNAFPDIDAPELQSTDDAPDALGKSIFFSENFRSDENIISFANHVFSVLMNDNENEADRLYTASDVLRKRKREEHNLPVEFNLIDSDASLTNRTQNELNFLCARIRKLLQEEGKRPEDIAVISYDNRYLNLLRRTLRRAGIPVKDGNYALLENTEVKTLIAILRAVQNPLSDIALVSLCTSPVFSFSSAELQHLRSYSDGAFWNALSRCAEEHNLSAAAKRAREVLSFLEYWNNEAQHTRLSAFLLRLFHKGNVLSALCRADENRRDNLLKIYWEACNFEVNGRRTLTEFLSYLTDRETQTSQSESDAQVQKGFVTLMTVHKSKGLEFPVCIFTQLGRVRRAKSGPFLDPARGLYHHLYDARHHYFYPTASEKILSRLRDEEESEESKRLLYVGITRASEKLILVDAQKKSIRDRFATGGILPYLAAGAIHSRELNSPSDMLLYSLRHDDGMREALKRYDAQSILTQECQTFHLHLIPPNTIPAPEDAPVVSAEKSAAATLDEAEIAAVRRSFEALEKRKTQILRPAKLSVSELLHMNDKNDLQQKSTLSFTREERLGAERGTAMHAFMQFCDFDLARRCCETEAARLYDLAFLTKEQAENLNFYALSRFFDSACFKEMEQSPSLRREMRFNVFLPLCTLLDTEDEGDVLVQGVIDCFYEKEDGTYAILDFKTDAVKQENGEQVLLARHSKQLTLYARALAELTGKQVTSLYLYSFALGKRITVNLPTAP